VARQCLSYLAALAVNFGGGQSDGEVARPGQPSRVRPHLARRRVLIHEIFEAISPSCGRTFVVIRRPFATRCACSRRAASLGIATWLSLPRGYWLAFSVAVILKPDYSTLFDRGLGGGRDTGRARWPRHCERTPTQFVLDDSTGGRDGVASTRRGGQLLVAMGFVTALVLILLSTSLHDAVGTAFDRFIDVTLGRSLLSWPISCGPRHRRRVLKIRSLVCSRRCAITWPSSSTWSNESPHRMIK